MTTLQVDLLVLGGGPGGYNAAFRAADLGLKTAIVERYPTLGGVCLNVGCIPSKALLHVAELIADGKKAHTCGVHYPPAQINLNEVRGHKEATVNKFTQGLSGLAKGRNVEHIQAKGHFIDDHTLALSATSSDSSNSPAYTQVQFKHCIIAAGSRPIELPGLPFSHANVWSSTHALQIPYVPNNLLIVGGGIIGLEMATVYHALGSQVTIVELGKQLIPSADADLVKVYQQANKNTFKALLNTKVINSELVSAKPNDQGVVITFESPQDNSQWQDPYDAVLVAVGRTPNSDTLGLENTRLKAGDRGMIMTDNQGRTQVPHIFAIGDITSGPMLAHKASHEGHVAAEAVAGEKSAFTPRCIPSIAYTHPEVAWVGETQASAKAKGLAVSIASYPWQANARAFGSGCPQGKTKIIYDTHSHRVLGAGIVGRNAGELLGELSLAIEFGADVEDIALTVHAHPTLNETIGLTAEVAHGSITELPNPKAKR